MQRIGTLHSHRPETGCYVDGHWGWRATGHMVRQFVDILFTLDDDELIIVDEYMSGCDDPDAMSSLADEVEAVINQAIASDLAAGWHDGEFFIYPSSSDDGREASTGEARADESISNHGGTKRCEK
jgi:hypothetical protein